MIDVVKRFFSCSFIIGGITEVETYGYFLWFNRWFMLIFLLFPTANHFEEFKEFFRLFLNALWSLLLFGVGKKVNLLWGFPVRRIEFLISKSMSSCFNIMTKFKGGYLKMSDWWLPKPLIETPIGTTSLLLCRWTTNRNVWVMIFDRY